MNKAKRLFMIAVVVIVAATGCLAFAACDASPTLDRDYSFRFNIAKTTVWDIPGVASFFVGDSGMELTKDGKVTVTVRISKNISSLLSSLGLDLSSVSSFDVMAEAEKYAVPILPWFDKTDLKGSFQKLNESLGGGLIVDYDEEATQKMINALESTGHLNEDFEIPKTFGLQYTGKYTVKHLKSEVTGKEYKALYLDRFSENGEPFLIVTLDDSGERAHAEMRVEFLKMVMAFDEKE